MWLYEHIYINIHDINRERERERHRTRDIERLRASVTFQSIIGSLGSLFHPCITATHLSYTWTDTHLYCTAYMCVYENYTYINYKCSGWKNSYMESQIPWVVSLSNGWSSPKAPAFGAGAHAQSPMAGAVTKAVVDGTTDGGHLGVLPWALPQLEVSYTDFPQKKCYLFIYLSI